MSTRPTVAVVGNGPSAANQGPLIDACDIVVRIRAFWRYGAVNAGKKTDVIAWFGNHMGEPSEFPPGGHKHWFTHCPEQLLTDAENMTGAVRMARFSRLVGLSCVHWLPDYHWKRACRHLNRHPSTGFIAVLMALEIYQPSELHLFGFDATGTNFNDARRDIPEDERLAHDMTVEKHAFADIFSGRWLGQPLPFPCKLVWPACPPEALPAFPGLTGNVAFIHVKGTSERVPGKALRELGGKPLFLHTIETCKKVPEISAIIIDSDSPRIRDLGTQAGALPLVRPISLATNAVAGDELETWAAYHAPDSDTIVVAIPTSPFITPETIRSALAKLHATPDADSIAATRSDKLFLWKKTADGNLQPAYGKSRTGQSMPETIWETTGLYIVRTAYVKEHQQRINYQKCLSYPVTPLEGIDINTEDDFTLSQIVWKGLHA